MFNPIRLAYEMRLRKQTYRALRRNGVQIPFHMSIGDCLVAKDIFAHRTYSLGFPYYKAATVVDVGAHKGFFSLFAAKNLAFGYRILAVEPSKQNLTNFEKVMRVNSVEGVEAIEACITGVEGDVDFFQSSDAANNSIYEEYSGTPGTTIQRRNKVKSFTLKSLLDAYNVDKVNFLKLDCEGAEYELLSCCDHKTLSKISVISMEYHDLKRPECNALALIGILKNAGFELLSVTSDPSEFPINSGKLVMAKPGF